MRSVRKIVVFPIVIYQKTLSFDHGPLRGMYPYGYCPFYPSCSEYCRQSVLKYGVMTGLRKGFWRILRCHPLTKGGVDMP